MAEPTKPNHFDPRRMFLAPKWNMFMVVVSLIALWWTLDAFLNAYRVPGWWPDAGWALLAVLWVHSVWTSASRLWHGRKAS